MENWGSESYDKVGDISGYLHLAKTLPSLIDADTQYFIAESTKTVDLVNNTKHAPGDEIWMGCGSVSKAGRLCERYRQDHVSL